MVIVVLVFLLLSLTQVPSANSQTTLCPKCGSTQVPYPLSTGDNCGDPRYKISCSNGVLYFISADGIQYRILSIDQNSNRLIINPPNILKNSCSSSDLSSGGLRLDETSPFNISTHNTVLLLNCSENILASPLNCSSNSFCRVYEDKVAVAEGCKNTLCCHYLKDSAMTSHRIRIRAGGCTAYTSMVNMQPNEPVGSWNYGIELQWVPPS